jgi:hypothetical protein
MKKIIIFLFLPYFAMSQDTVIIKKVFIDPDTLWQVKKVMDADNVNLFTFADSNQILPFITNDIVDDARKMADALNIIEKQNKFINDLIKLDKITTAAKVEGAFDYLQNNFSSFWIGDYNAVVNVTKVIAGAQIFVNQSGSLRIKIGETLNRPLFIISDTYGFILNYPNQGDRTVIYKTKANVLKDFDNKLILKKKKP